jgi:hypothetical protein
MGVVFLSPLESTARVPGFAKYVRYFPSLSIDLVGFNVGQLWIRHHSGPIAAHLGA